MTFSKYFILLNKQIYINCIFMLIVKQYLLNDMDSISFDLVSIQVNYETLYNSDLIIKNGGYKKMICLKMQQIQFVNTNTVLSLGLLLTETINSNLFLLIRVLIKRATMRFSRNQNFFKNMMIKKDNVMPPNGSQQVATKLT